MRCDDCVFADWRLTSNGRLHPSKEGKCKVNKVIKLPYSESTYRNENQEIKIKGGTIFRGHDFVNCAYFGRSKCA